MPQLQQITIFHKKNKTKCYIIFEVNCKLLMIFPVPVPCITQKYLNMLFLALADCPMCLLNFCIGQQAMRKLSWLPSTAVLIEKREIWGAFCLNENFFLWFPMFEPFSLLPRSPSGLPRTAEPVLLAYIAEIYNFAARQSHILFP